MNTLVRNMGLSLCFLALLTLANCSGQYAQSLEEDQETGPPTVAISAAFTSVESVYVYDEFGEPLVDLPSSGSNEFLVGLNPGIYYLDIRDKYGNGVFDENSRLLFAPRVDGAEAEIVPYEHSNFETPLIKVIVGEHTHDDDISALRQALHTFYGDTNWMRARLVWEGARALVGSEAANGYVWSTAGKVEGTYNYAGEDWGAWESLRYATTKDGDIGWYLSCRRDNGTARYSCSDQIQYSASNPSQYGLQGGIGRGGQCKPFTNLVAYRSGVFHGPNWAFVALPSDGNTNESSAPYSTPSTVKAGDILRNRQSNEEIHSVIVVHVTNNSNNDVVVLDSNWNGGDGAEQIGTHIMNYAGSGRDNLGRYNTYNCIYSEDGC